MYAETLPYWEICTRAGDESLKACCFKIKDTLLTVALIILSVTMSSSEIISCSECGQRFDTIDALREHEKSEQQDKELQSKGL